MKEHIKNFIYAISTILAIGYSTNQYVNLKQKYLFYKPFKIDILLAGILFVIFYILINRNKEKKISKSKKISCILFTIFMIIGEVIYEAGTYEIIFDSVFTVVLTCLKAIGFYHIFRICFIYLDDYIANIKIKEIKPKNKKLKWLLNQFDNHPFRTSLILILLSWSIYIIAFYPIVLSPDPSYQIKQYFNVPTKYIDWVIQRDPNVFMTTHHPITQTYLLGWSIELGRFILNDNFGLFIYNIFQTAIYSSVLAYTIKFAKEHKVKNILLFIMLAIYMFVPMFPFYSISAVKDTLYTAFMILFVLFIYDLIDKNKALTWKSAIYLALVMILLSLFRHNGIYIILLTLPFILAFSKVNRKKIISATVVSLIVIMSFNKILVPALGISEGSIREMLSVPFQQTARLVKYHKKDISEEDKKIINKILFITDLGQRYDPELADPVKNKFNKETTTSDLVDYFKVWAKYLVSHPGTYINATLNNNYGYFYPNDKNWYFYYKYEMLVTQDNLVDYSFTSWSKGIRDVLTKWGYLFESIPFIGLISSIGANLWIMIIISAYLLTNNKKKYLIALVPLYGSFLICMISPANTYFRYAMPYIFALPVLTMLIFTNIRGVKNEKK